MRTLIRRALPLAVAFVAASCIIPRGQADPLGGTRDETSPGTPKGGSMPDRGIMPKRVTYKQEPNILHAKDGTSCTVTPDRYRKVKIGKYEVCAWR